MARTEQCTRCRKSPTSLCAECIREWCMLHYQSHMCLPPISRKPDPVTSDEAGKEITESGTRSTLMSICLRTIMSTPGMTAGEVGDATRLGHERVWRRISDLKNRGYIYADGTRIWHSRAQMLWWPA
jgi:hypothetical protein